MPYLPEGPGYRDPSDTSLDAAVHIAPSVGTYEAKCLAALKAHGDLTPDEAAEKMGVSVLTIRPRFTALRDAGKIADTGQRRRNSNGRNTTVWRLA